MANSRRPYGSVVSIAGFGALMASAGCSDLFGFERATTLVTCVQSSDCQNALSCIFNACTMVCLTNDDCAHSPLGPDYMCGPAGACVAKADDSVDASSEEATGSPDAPLETTLGSAAEGSCGDTRTSVDNCGSCGNVCSGNHASSACADSVCVVNACEAGWSDCNGDPSDGCEVDLTSDAANCGRCAHACASTVCDDMQVCASDVCSNSVCLALSIPGLLSSKTTDSVLASDHAFLGYQINVPTGWLTAFGIITAPLGTQLPDGGIVSVTSHGYIGLYSDSDGFPAKLVAMAKGGEELTIPSDLHQIFAVAPPVQLTVGYYWIAVVFDQFVNFSATPGDVKLAVASIPVSSSLAPLPSLAPQTTLQCNPASMPCNLEPALYVVVAQ
jgi:hypothetical protein